MEEKNFYKMAMEGMQTKLLSQLREAHPELDIQSTAIDGIRFSVIVNGKPIKQKWNDTTNCLVGLNEIDARKALWDSFYGSFENAIKELE
jgi:hypothetical protein